MYTLGNKNFYTFTEAAKMLNITRATLYKKVREGYIPEENVLGRRMINLDFLEDALKGALKVKRRKGTSAKE